MSSTVGKTLRVTLWGQSHSPAVGVTVDGFPAGYRVDFDGLRRFMERRAPGRDDLSTARREDDEPEFLSGLRDGVTCGAPITAVIKNADFRPVDYAGFDRVPRPGHADYTAGVKYGPFADFSGGGHFSGRLTAPLCVAGALVIGLLFEYGVTVEAGPVEIGGVSGSTEEMKKEIARAREDGDSVGGVIECVVSGVPAGIGDPIFDGMESAISGVLFGIPAVKGVEFGSGFSGAKKRGSENNDPFTAESGKVITAKNDHGGILGGITTGMPIVVRAAFKPTPSIAKEQQSVDLETLEGKKIAVRGRHDPCVALRAIPAVESACAIAVLDAMLTDGAVRSGRM